MSEWARAASLDDCPPGALLGIQLAGEIIVLANVDGNVYALQDECSHEDFPLSDGDLDGSTVECLYHGASFDLRTGKPLRLPAVRSVRTFQVEIRDRDVFILLE